MSKGLEKRRQAIVDIVNQMGAANFSQLKECFEDVSEVTLRKDLKALDERGLILRVHGGAKATPQSTNFNMRSSINPEKKSVIAMKARELIKPSNSLFITAGTTCSELAKQLPSMPLYVVTDGLLTAANVPNDPLITLEIVGGEVDRNIMRVSSLAVLGRLSEMHFNIAFLGTPTFHPKYGFSYLNALTAATVKKAMDCSDCVVMLMDSTKVNYTVTPHCISTGNVDILVTDGDMDRDVTAALEDKGIKVL